MHFGYCLLFLALQSKPPSPAVVSPAFADALANFVKLENDLDKSVPSQKPTKEAEQISDRQNQLAVLLSKARQNAHQGDIFTPQVSREFREVIRKAFQSPEGAGMLQTIRDRDTPPKPIVLKVNQSYPDDEPRPTMSPTLLNSLPALPKELQYGILGHSLILQDVKTSLIVDFIPSVIP